MSEPEAKRRKFFNNKNKNYYVQKSKRQFLESGQHGFLATCNFREKDCVRESYNILNQYADELYGPQTKEGEEQPDKDSEGDITDELQKQINEAKEDAKEKKFRFQVVDTGANNCIFIKTTLPDPVELGVKIVRDIAEKGTQRTRFLLRLVPISTVCRANLKDILEAAGTLFDKHFLKESHTYSIIFNKRYNNNISRDEIIKELADIVAAKNIKNKVDLKNPELCILVEVIKGLCCISVLPDYIKLKKYNLVELASKPTEKTDEKSEDKAEAKPDDNPEKKTDDNAEEKSDDKEKAGNSSEDKQAECTEADS